MSSRPTLFSAMTVLLALSFMVMHVPAAFSLEETKGLVGRWEFDDGTGKDLSGNGNRAVLNGTQIVSLGNARACVMLMPETGPVQIPVSENSPLAIARGTLCFWLNVGWTHSNILSFDNKAVQLNVYRGDFQVRFSGGDAFKYGSGILDYNWPKYDMREWAFYGHPRAAVHDSTWHHFAVAYDDEGKRIVGWRDGELLSVVDLSQVKTEPLQREGLTEITLGKGFAGYMDDLRIYNRVLADADIRGIYNSAKSVFVNRFDTNPTDRTHESYRYKKEDRTLYQAWLQSRPVAHASAESCLNNIVASNSNSTIQTATRELQQAVETMFGVDPKITDGSVDGPKVVIGTSETSSWIKQRASELGLEHIMEDGFILKAIREGGDPVLVIAGRIPAGCVFGTFDLIRRLRLGQDLRELDVLENPQIPIRMVNHWSYFRGFLGDKWRGGGRDDSIYSWEELRTGDHKLIRDWVRLLASAGWNAICPSEINWDYRDNFLDHLDEVETLAGILRDYGMRLYWSPSYLLALDPNTADRLYARVPDMGGYLMKLGSEKQNGDPRPPMVNRIADTLAPHGGTVLVRAFVYGNYRYTPKPYRHLMPHDIFVPEAGHYRENVVLVPKGSAGDWDLSAPIPAIDGALQKTLMGSELVIDKSFPSSWVEKWRWWLEQDTYRNGPGSLNRFSVHCIMGVAMISPSPAWTESPLNMVNYYGLGRMAWNPDRSLDEIYTEWIQQTFGNDPQVIETIMTILFISDDAARKLYLYRGYRGIWIDRNDAFMVENKTPYAINSQGIGPASPELKRRLLRQYAPGLRDVYGDPLRAEEFLTSFHFAKHDDRLSLGRTLIQDVYGGMEEAVELARQMGELWASLEGRIDPRRFDYAAEHFSDFVKDAKKQRDRMVQSFEEHTGRKQDEALAALTASNLAQLNTFNVRHHGAVADGSTNDAAAINRAIDTCHRAGGGTVFIPSGMYATGSIHLKSDVTLALDAGAVLKAMPGAMDPREPNPHDQGLVDSAHFHWEASLIWGKNLKNIKILGPGVLDGSALTRRSEVPGGGGDKGIALKLCQNIEIRNLTIRGGGRCAILATGCEDLRIDNVTITTGSDGLNLSQCSKVEVSHCHIDAVRYAEGVSAGSDDAIKLGSDLSLGKARPSQDITVRNCYLAGGSNGIQLGSETVAPFHNIRLENIRILRAGKAGIGTASNAGSGIRYENVTFVGRP